ncbi:MmcQ/YjbR family DNA-binding protein [Nocardioides acrostichi]|uniref:MmcQ/YjbR family DNA-binding protein n=1 Tax=Nocardioides acrostichi TaxID=2784339 RepID=UPI002E2B2597|nr:MmcQ/YjbR family DNA-binding protein [Nocardioides acrostichi]
MRESRPATSADVDEICLGLPEVTLGTSWGDVPTYLVRGRGFVLFRHPHPSATDPATGQPYDDLLVISVASLEDVEALTGDPSTPFFTIEHFTNHRAKQVLVQQSRLGELSLAELSELITDAYCAKAPKTLVRTVRQDV